MQFLSALQPFALVALRIVLAIIFTSHGYPKLVHSSANMQTFFFEHGLPGYFVYVAGILETFGGGLLLLGLFTRVAALLLALEMSVAIWKVHSLNGYFAVHEYEFPLALAANCFALATIGAGALSLDQVLFGSGRSKPRASRGSKD